MYLSLPIPNKKNLTLEDCIAEFSKEENIGKENCWFFIFE